MKIERIVEEGSRENITYVGYVSRETDDMVVLVFYDAQRSKPPYFAIKKARILSRQELTPKGVRATKPKELAEAVA